MISMSFNTLGRALVNCVAFRSYILYLISAAACVMCSNNAVKYLYFHLNLLHLVHYNTFKQIYNNFVTIHK